MPIRTTSTLSAPYTVNQNHKHTLSPLAVPWQRVKDAKITACLPLSRTYAIPYCMARVFSPMRTSSEDAAHVPEPLTPVQCVNSCSTCCWRRRSGPVSPR